MTVETGLALIHVSGNTLMFFIRILPIMFVTINAGEAVVVAADVAVGAGIPSLMMSAGVDREVEIVVIKDRALPGDGGVA